MGFELNKLMKQYGVGTASMANYAGADAPGNAPTPPKLEEVATSGSAMGKALTKAQIASNKEATDKFDADKAAFDEAMRKYQLDQKSYNQYRDAYQNRLQGTNMYNQPQFMGAGQTYTPQWTDQVKGPTYGAVPLSVGQMTPEQKAQYYLSQRDIGYTDADLRAATTKTFGAPKESDWTELLNRAYPQYKGAVEGAYGNIGRTGFSGATGIDNPGYNYWMNQLSTGAVKPEDLNNAVLKAADTWMPGTQYDASKVPGQFDWGYYVSKYPDLGKAGIDSLQEAQRHYALYGQNEGRSPYEGWTAPVGPFQPGTTTVTGGGTNTATDTNTNTGGYVDQPINYTGGGKPYDYDYNIQLYAKGGEVKDLADKYKVKTHYQSGGRTMLGYESPEVEAEWQQRWADQQAPVETFAVPSEAAPAVGGPVEPMPPLSTEAAGSVLQQAAGAKTISRADAARVRESLGPNGQGEFQNWLTKNNITVEGGAPQVNVALNTAAAAEGAPKAAASPADAREAGLNALLSKYGPGDSIYAPELKAARERATKESDAFAKMLQNALANPEDAQTSKAEMYFRLAAAFGSPTKTGKFTENLAMAGKEMGEYAKGKRESAREKLALQLKAQELRMGSAKDELATLRALSAEEMKDKRAIATQLIKEYIESGKPQSAAGKQALDEGLVPGTPEFQKRVAQIAEVKVDQQMASINAMLGNLAVAQAGLTLRQQQAGKLSPAEVQMKRDTEDSLSAIGSAMRDIGEAYRLNPSTFDTSAVDTAKRKALELAGSKDPRLLATRTLENLLKSEMITSAAEKMKGVLSDSDIKLLQSIQGLDAKSVEERANILRNAYAKLKNAQTRQQRRLEDIGSGLYGRVSGE